MVLASTSINRAAYSHCCSVRVSIPYLLALVARSSAHLAESLPVFQMVWPRLLILLTVRETALSTPFRAVLKAVNLALFAICTMLLVSCPAPFMPRCRLSVPAFTRLKLACMLFSLACALFRRICQSWAWAEFSPNAFAMASRPR